jgi:hypothetical protein
MPAHILHRIRPKRPLVCDVCSKAVRVGAAVRVCTHCKRVRHFGCSSLPCPHCHKLYHRSALYRGGKILRYF